MFQTAKEIGERTPTAPCRCNKPVPGVVLEDKDGKILETLCAQCCGAIRLKEELGDDWKVLETLCARCCEAIQPKEEPGDDWKVLETLCARYQGLIERTPGEPGPYRSQRSIVVTGRLADGTVVSETLATPEDAWAQYMPFSLWGTTYWVMP
jgi:hypothetical protein